MAISRVAEVLMHLERPTDVSPVNTRRHQVSCALQTVQMMVCTHPRPSRQYQSAAVFLDLAPGGVAHLVVWTRSAHKRAALRGSDRFYPTVVSLASSSSRHLSQQPEAGTVAGLHHCVCTLERVSRDSLLLGITVSCGRRGRVLDLGIEGAISRWQSGRTSYLTHRSA
ncbi:hypothetical protein T440DRAFT_17700 [Plenodomus tracheiphilus IPT5]|uniref:Uncharacterized protein n=1 Tax=Plenodomus tracheiphilus IPT5 TaxID=1408161 RepID=A0A6A7BBX6_9PLEO|nr:hypothetical protein T440DRAFT_17700 [Plenodomus tracheiphilus IPT5]